MKKLKMITKKKNYKLKTNTDSFRIFKVNFSKIDNINKKIFRTLTFFFYSGQN